MEARIVDGVWSESAVLEVLRPGWQSRASCKGHTDLFFAGKSSTGRPTKQLRLQIQTAKRICHECPVISECLAFALDNEEAWGIWGGFTAPERNMIRRRRDTI